jgi:hypothetical protein
MFRPTNVALLTIAPVALSAAPCMGQWWWPPTNGALLSPTCPSPSAPIYVAIGGQWPNSCPPNTVQVVRTGTNIDLNVSRVPPPIGCPIVITNWTMLVSVGPLPAGTYSLYSTYYLTGSPDTDRVLLQTFDVSDTCPAACYPNCDGSTGSPVLNVQDFTCFLQKFAAGDLAANCDGSSNPPVLNIADFTCFFQKFSIGCP